MHESKEQQISPIIIKADVISSHDFVALIDSL